MEPCGARKQSAAGVGYSLILTTENKVRFSLNDGSNQKYLDSLDSVQSDRPYFVIIQVKASEMTMNLNAGPQGATPISPVVLGSLDMTSKLVLGHSVYGNLLEKYNQTGCHETVSHIVSYEVS